MKNILLLLAVLFAHALTAYAQTDTISVEKERGRIAYKKGGEYLSLKTLEKALKDDAEATKLYRISKNERATGIVFSLLGGFFLGYEAGRALGSGTNVKPVSLVIGAGLIGLSISFSISAHNNIRTAVRTYNRNKQLSGFDTKIWHL